MKLTERLEKILRRGPSAHGYAGRAYRSEFARRSRATIALLIARLRRAAGLGVTTLGAFRYWRALEPNAQSASRRGPMAESPAVVMLVVSDLRIDPRVLREAKALAAAGYRVEVLCPDLSSPSLAAQPLDWGPEIRISLLPWDAASFAMHPPWLFGDMMHAEASARRPFAFHCHDLTTAVIGLSAARRTGARCICDFHEWYSENVSWNKSKERWEPHPRAKRLAYRLAERLVLWRADAVITVCDSIAKELSETLSARHRHVDVIRNIPSLKRNDAISYAPLRETLAIPEDQFVLLWQGGTGPSRMIEPIIRALALAPRVTFVIRGPSLDVFGEGYLRLARASGVEGRLKLLPPVPSQDVVVAAESADAGIWTLPNLSKNFYYALPNKIFEYLASGLPVLAANFPEARRMVEGNDVGLCFDPYDPSSIAAQLNRLTDEPGLLSRLRTNIPAALAAIDADNEWNKLVAIYDRLSGRASVRQA